MNKHCYHHNHVHNADTKALRAPVVSAGQISFCRYVMYAISTIQVAEVRGAR